MDRPPAVFAQALPLLFAAHDRARRFGMGSALQSLRDALAHRRPLHEDHLAPIALLADPRAAGMITPERGHELLATRRG